MDRVLFATLAVIVSACGAERLADGSKPSASDDAPTDSGAPELAADTDAPEDPADGVVQLEVVPERIELGTVDPRCSHRVELVLTATGDRPTGEFAVTAPDGWTATVYLTSLSPGESTTVVLVWDGMGEDPSGTVQLDVAELGLVTVPIVATAVEARESVTVDLRHRNEADLLLAVDRSCNMDDMARLEPHWPTLRHHLADLGIALRMSSVVEDDGCVLGDPIVLDDSFDDDAFRAALWAQQNWDGTWGRLTERLLALSVRAVTATCNAALVQRHAPLHILAFSNEPDQSDAHWSEYVAELEMIPDAGVPLTVHGIGGEESSTCAAQIYTGVREATEATRGVFLDFCSPDWDVALTELAEGIAVASRRLFLPSLTTDGGVPEAVYASGVEQSGWSWDGGPYLELPEDIDANEVTVELLLPAVCE